MYRYRITKYNPEFRDEKGCYLRNDWTSISDIGKIFYDGLLTMEKYLEIENLYIQVISSILEENNITCLTITDLEKDEEPENISFLTSNEKELYTRVVNNMSVNNREIKEIIKFALRELLWCKLSSELKAFEIEFGYDYYMYIKCNKKILSSNILAGKMFVELLSID